MKSKKHLARVAELPCCICSVSPVQVHHIRDMAVSGAGQRASDYFTMPLCPPCHARLHADKAAWERQHGSQFGWVAETLKILYG